MPYIHPGVYNAPGWMLFYANPAARCYAPFWLWGGRLSGLLFLRFARLQGYVYASTAATGEEMI